MGGSIKVPEKAVDGGCLAGACFSHQQSGPLHTHLREGMSGLGLKGVVEVLSVVGAFWWF